ncbi:hypothetical protein DY000_02037739 [Brassica cretica]|uniref:Uncharacterized protein n=1 Tax=Brassica cretica TaxID=69181 RepID=A0ABQ7BAL3_BRACR|nr:hypothetical protein DY000_02037739 [Brassica cretica]
MYLAIHCSPNHLRRLSPGKESSHVLFHSNQVNGVNGGLENELRIQRAYGEELPVMLIQAAAE